MNGQKEYWDRAFNNSASAKPKYDLWLDKHGEILRETEGMPVIELGCGLGNDSLYLTANGYDVICCDISEVALEKLKAYVPAARTKLVDLRDGLPFEDSGAQIIVADLCLHYFCWEETKRISNDLGRVLKPGGYLLCRVNSTNDVNYGAGQGREIEKNFYEVEGTQKRFFDREAIELLFTGWDIRYVSEYQVDRYRHPKILWEIVVKKLTPGI